MTYVTPVPSIVDVLLVGAGPIGIEMAVALNRSDISYYHIEAGCLASTISWNAPGTTFFSSAARISIAGVPFEVYPHFKATREEYLLYLRNVVAQFNLSISLGRCLEHLTQNSDGGFTCTIEHTVPSASTPNVVIRSGIYDEVRARNIILATGDMHTANLLGIAGEDLPLVDHYFREPHFYTNTSVSIVGGRNSAVEAAIRLCKAGARVRLLYRRAELDKQTIKPWLMPEFLSLVRDKRITTHFSASPTKIEPGALYVMEVHGEQRFESDHILLLTGYRQDYHFLNRMGVTVEGEQHIPVLSPETMESTVKGLYVIGTAVAGTQSQGVRHFIETSHVHINRVLRAFGVNSYPEFGLAVRTSAELEQ